MLNIIYKTLLALLSAIVFQAASATEEESFRQKLIALYPSTEFGFVQKSPLPDLFEVQLGKKVVYVHKDGRHFIFGSIYDMQTQQDLTQQAMQRAARIDWDALPLQNAIVFGQEGAKHQLAVFSDPDCPFCYKLEKELEHLTDTTVYVFPFPIVSLHPDARQRSIAIWCAQDSAKAWRDYLFEKIQPPSSTKDCVHPVDTNLELGRRLGIAATPTLIRSDGATQSGAMSVQRVREWLAQRGVQ